MISRIGAFFFGAVIASLIALGATASGFAAPPLSLHAILVVHGMLSAVAIGGLLSDIFGHDGYL